MERLKLLRLRRGKKDYIKISSQNKKLHFPPNDKRNEANSFKIIVCGFLVVSN